MRQLTDTEVLMGAETLTKRHRSEWCRLVYEASAGRSMPQVANLLGHDRQWVREHLDWYAMESAGGCGAAPSDGVKRNDVRAVVKQFAPDEPDEDYIAEYESEGHTPEVARILAAA